jgi:hypothetical protein
MTTVNAVALLAAAWPGTTTPIFPDIAAGGTVVDIIKSESTVKDALKPLNVTFVAPVKPDPLTVTVVPTAPVGGEKEVICGGVDPDAKPLGAVAKMAATMPNPAMSAFTDRRPLA